MFGIKFCPENFIIIPLAVALDIAGVLVLCCGLDDFGLLDIIGMIFIDGYYMVRDFVGGKISVKKIKGAIGFIENAFTSKWGKFLTPTLCELVPGLGAGPFWTISAYLNRIK